MCKAHNWTRHAFELLITRVHTSSLRVELVDRPCLRQSFIFYQRESYEKVSMNRNGMHPSTCESNGEQVIVMA